MSGEAYSILKHNKGVDERDKDASGEAYVILKHNKGVGRHDKAIN